MICTTNELKKLFPNYKQKNNKNLNIKTVSKDSRLEMKDVLFVPIIGENFDGHTFISGAIKNGAIATLWDKSRDIPEDVPESFIFFLVDDTVVALQQLAQYYRDKVSPIVIGITGSNGKTTTKDIVHSILQQKYETYATVGNYNNEIGLPLTILQMKQTTEVLVLEMGMSDAKEIELLTKIARPHYAIITNIGESHIEQLKTVENIAKSKLEIVTGLQPNGTLIIDGDETYLAHMHDEDYVIKASFHEESHYKIENVAIHPDQTSFTINGTSKFTVPLLGKHHAKNATYAIIIGKKLHVSDEQIQSGLLALQHTSMRFERIKGKNGVTIINDAYNASATSMKAGIEVVKAMDGYQKKIIVLGDILELGEHAKLLHESVAQVIDEQLDALFTIGDHAQHIMEQTKANNIAIKSTHFKNEAALIQALQAYLNEQTLLFFKASRGMRFEKIIDKII